MNLILQVFYKLFRSINKHLSPEFNLLWNWDKKSDDPGSCWGAQRSLIAHTEPLSPLQGGLTAL